MKIEDGKKYRTGRGDVITIGGTTRYYKDWCWSIQGDWYERATGRRIGYRQTDRIIPGTQDHEWEHYVRTPSGDDITEEVQ